MSIISDSVNRASLQAQTLLGESFLYLDESYTGVFNEVSREVQHEDEGYRLIQNMVCVATKSQFASEPVENKKITYAGNEYIIESVSVGVLHYTLNLIKLTI